MTKQEVWEAFKEEILPGIKEREKQGSGRVDEPMRAEAWNNYTDQLCKMGAITPKQYHDWTHPTGLYPKRKKS